MPRYRATQDYRAAYRGRLVAYIKGAEVEIDDTAEADWVNRDSPGTLAEVKAEVKAAPAKKPAGGA